MTHHQPVPSAAVHGRRYYRVRGGAPVLGSLVALLIGAAIAAAGAYAYAVLCQRSPIIYLNILLVAAYAWLIGAATGAGARIGKVRSLRTVQWLAAGAAGVGLYVSWALWLTAVFSHYPYTFYPHMLVVPEGSFWELGTLWKGVAVIYERGTWGLMSTQFASAGVQTVSGPILGAIWLAEGVLLVVLAMVTARLRTTRRAFCESCHAWCSAPRVVHCYSLMHNPVEIKLRMQEADWAYLGTLAAASDREPGHLALLHERCPRCRQTHMLTLQRVAIGHSSLPEPLTGYRRTSVSGWVEYLVGLFTGEGRSSSRTYAIMDKLLVTESDLAIIESTPPAAHLHEAQEELPPEADAAADDYVDLGN